MRKNELAKKLSNFIPIFAGKLLRPFEQQIKNLVSPLHMQTMTILSEKELFTMTEISNEMTMSRQQMTPIIDKLVDSGFVQREHDNIDRRSIKISLTSVGLDFLNNFNNQIANIIESRIDCLDKDDLISLNHALDDLYRIIYKIQK